METKTYFASSVPAALEVARKELGEDALLVTSRPTPPEARAFGRLEVTFAWDPKPARVLPEPGRGGGYSPISTNKSELDDIRQQISALRVAVGGNGIARLPEAAERLSAGMQDGGLGAGIASEIATACVRRGGDPHSALVQEFTSRISCLPFSAMKTGESRTLALIGPPGRGKTTTLVKIAGCYGIAKRIPVKIRTAGSLSVFGEEQMARFATILGAPFLACESLESLNLALIGDAWKGLSLIDTPGISPSDTKEIEEFTRFFSRRPGIERHLVLRAEARCADLAHVISRFSGMGIERLLFTGLDETLSLGPMAETMMRSRIPTTFAGTGQQLPDDLQTVNAESLARAVCGERAMAAIAA